MWCLDEWLTSELRTAVRSANLYRFDEKVKAAQVVNAKLIVIGRASEEEGIGFVDVLDYLRKRFVIGK